MVVANITIVDGKSYYATVRFSGKREEHGETIEFSGVADLDYRHAETFEGGIRYDLSANAQDTKVVFEKWNIRSDSVTCSLTTPATLGNPDVPPSGTLFVYSVLRSYVFQALLGTEGTVNCKDGDTTYEREVQPTVLLTTSKGPPDLGFQALGDENELKGDSMMTMRLNEDEEDKDVVMQTISWIVTRFRN